MASAVSAAQTGPPRNDADFIGLTTPFVLGKDKSQVGLQVNAFGGSDQLLRTGVSLAHGLADNWQVKIAGTFARFDTFDLGSGQSIGYGGSAGDLLWKYRSPGTIDFAIEAGLGYSNTPAQEQKVETLASLSASYSVASGLQVYVNPKLVTLIDNPLFAVAIGANVDVAPGISLFGDWTPYVSGDNSLSTADGSRVKQQLYAFGVRFSKLAGGLAVDVAYTNIIGQTAGFSLTPSLGNTGGLYVGLAYGF